MSVHFSSKTELWATPQKFFNDMAAQYGPFDIDVCADASNAKCPVYFDKAADGLAQTWTGRCWMNPPYGRDIGKWMKKASESNATVVCLVPARTDTNWWRDYAVNCAPFPSAVVVFRGHNV